MVVGVGRGRGGRGGLGAASTAICSLFPLTGHTGGGPSVVPAEHIYCRPPLSIVPVESLGTDGIGPCGSVRSI